MKTGLLFATALLAPLLADDAWKKLETLKTGAELRIFKEASAQPIAAEFADANETHLIVIVRKEQMAIPKEEIARVDARPISKESRVKRETTEKKVFTPPESPGQRTPYSRPPSGTDSQSTSSSISVGSKPAFETVYRKSAAKN